MSEDFTLNQKKPDAARDFLSTAAYSAIEEPILGLCQIVDKTTGSKHMQTVQQAFNNMGVTELMPSEFGTVSWGAQQLGAAIGMMLPFLLVQKGVRAGATKLFGEAAIATGVKDIGLLSKTGLAKLTAKEMALAGATGFTYDSILRPSQTKENGNLLADRLTNGVTGAATFATLTGTGIGLKKLGTTLATEGKALKAIASTALTNPISAGIISAVPAGFVAAEGHALATGNLAPSWKETQESIGGFAFVGGALGAVHLLGAQRTGSARTNLDHFLTPADNPETKRTFKYLGDQKSLDQFLQEANGSGSAEAMLPVREYLGKGVFGGKLGVWGDKYGDVRQMLLKHQGESLTSERAGQAGIIGTCQLLDGKLGTRSVFKQDATKDNPVWVNRSGKDHIVLSNKLSNDSQQTRLGVQSETVEGWKLFNLELDAMTDKILKSPSERAHLDTYGRVGLNDWKWHNELLSIASSIVSLPESHRLQAIEKLAEKFPYYAITGIEYLPASERHDVAVSLLQKCLIDGELYMAPESYFLKTIKRLPLDEQADLWLAYAKLAPDAAAESLNIHSNDLPIDKSNIKNAALLFFKHFPERRDNCDLIVRTGTSKDNFVQMFDKICSLPDGEFKLFLTEALPLEHLQSEPQRLSLPTVVQEYMRQIRLADGSPEAATAESLWSLYVRLSKNNRSDLVKILTVDELRQLALAEPQKGQERKFTVTRLADKAPELLREILAQDATCLLYDQPGTQQFRSSFTADFLNTKGLDNLEGLLSRTLFNPINALPEQIAQRFRNAPNWQQVAGLMSWRRTICRYGIAYEPGEVVSDAVLSEFNSHYEKLIADANEYAQRAKSPADYIKQEAESMSEILHCVASSTGLIQAHHRKLLYLLEKQLPNDSVPIYKSTLKEMDPATFRIAMDTLFKHAVTPDRSFREQRQSVDAGWEEYLWPVRLAAVFQKSLVQPWLKKNAELGRNDHDACNWIPLAPASQLRGLSHYLFKNIDKPLANLEIVAKHWADGLTAEQKQLPIAELLEQLKTQLYPNVKHTGFAEQSHKFAISAKKYAQYESRFLASLDKPPVYSTTHAWQSGKLTGRFLERSDPRGLYLGQYTECCQHPEHESGESCAWYGQEAENSGFFVVENEEGKIIAQSWVWVADDGGFCFDNIEGLRSEIPNCEKDIINIYNQTANELSQTHHTVTVGTTRSDVELSQWPDARGHSLPIPRNYPGFSDSQDILDCGQVLLAQNAKLRPKVTVNSLYL